MDPLAQKFILYAGVAFAFALYPFVVSRIPNAPWAIHYVASVGAGIILWLAILGILVPLLLNRSIVPIEFGAPAFDACASSILILGLFAGLFEVDWAQQQSFEYQLGFWLGICVGTGAFLRKRRITYSERNSLDNLDQGLQKRLVQLGLSKPESATSTPKQEEENPILNSTTNGLQNDDLDSNNGGLPKIDAW